MVKKKKQKKLYIRPKIKSEKIFETTALACGKCIANLPRFQAACMGVPRVS